MRLIIVLTDFIEHTPPEDEDSDFLLGYLSDFGQYFLVALDEKRANKLIMYVEKRDEFGVFYLVFQLKLEEKILAQTKVIICTSVYGKVDLIGFPNNDLDRATRIVELLQSTSC